MRPRLNPVYLALCSVIVLTLLFSLTRINLSVQALASVFVTPSGAGDCSQADPCSLATGLSTVDEGGTLYAAAGTYTGSGNQVVLLD